VIEDQEALGFDSFRQMNEDAEPGSVSVSAELQQDEKVCHAWLRSPCTACRVLAAKNILLVSVSGHLIIKNILKHGLLWVSKNMFVFLLFSSLLF